MNGPWIDVIITIIASFLGIGLIAVAIEGFWRGRLNWFFRLFFLFGAGLILFGNIMIQLLGFLIAVVLLLIHLRHQDVVVVEA